MKEYECVLCYGNSNFLHRNLVSVWLASIWSSWSNFAEISNVSDEITYCLSCGTSLLQSWTILDYARERSMEQIVCNLNWYRNSITSSKKLRRIFRGTNMEERWGTSYKVQQWLVLLQTQFGRWYWRVSLHFLPMGAAECVIEVELEVCLLKTFFGPVVPVLPFKKISKNFKKDEGKNLFLWVTFLVPYPG